MAIITSVEVLEEMIDHCLAQGAFAFDVETVGEHRLDPRRAEVTWISFATDGGTYVVPMGHHGELKWQGQALLKTGRDKMARGKTREELRPSDFSKNKVERVWGDPPHQLSRSDVFPRLTRLFFSDALKIGHNIKYDLHAVSQYLGLRFPDPPYYDTLIASWLLDVTRRGKLGLADCVARELGRTLEKGVGEDITQHAFSVVADYSEKDARATWELKVELDRQYAAASRRTRMLLNLEHRVLEPVLAMEQTGVLIDRDRLDEIDADLRRDIDALQGLARSLTGRTDFNPRSNRHKQEALFLPKRAGGLGLRPLRVTPGAKDKAEEEIDIHDCAVDHETLEHYRGEPLVDVLAKYAAKTKLHGTYVLPYRGGYPVRDPDEKAKFVASRLVRGRIHGTFRQHGAESGRFSSRDPNLQNIPSRTEDGKKLREIFVSDPGTLLCVADYSQIEPRIIASLARDSTMIRTYNEGGDVYQTVADRMSVSRNIGKELVLSIAYGVGAERIAARIGCQPKEARDLMDFFNDRFPAILQHKNLVVARARRDRYAETVLGRRRPLPRIAWSSREEQAAAERQAYNHVIQGTAADIMKIALVNIHVSLPEGAALLMTVHDEVVVQCPEDMVGEVTDVVRAEMEQARPPTIIVPLVVDAKSGRSWRDAK